MDATTQIAIERAKAEKKSPAVLWLVNLLWPGLGNLAVGQNTLGILFGLIQWLCIGLTIVTFGFGAIVLSINWVTASAVGHAKLSQTYSDALRRIEIAS
jgi:hypothetical protein